MREERESSDIPYLNEAQSFLHGVLDFKIISASHLKPIGCGIGSLLPKVFQKDIRNKEDYRQVKGSLISHLPALGGLSNPYVDIYVVNAKTGQRSLIARTQCRRNTLFPSYNERFSVPVCENIEMITITLIDKRPRRDIFLGELSLTYNDVLTQCCSRTGLCGTFPLSKKSSLVKPADLDRYASKWMKVRSMQRVRYGKRGGRGLGWINLQMRFTEVAKDLMFLDNLNSQIIKANGQAENELKRNYYFSTDPNSLYKLPEDLSLEQSRNIVRDTYFNPRFNEKFTLYIGSHQPGLNSLLPKLEMNPEKGTYFEAQSCLIDILQALREAKEFVCIAMDTFDVGFKLDRLGHNHDSETSIGELLQNLAKDGVLVLILLNKTKENKLVKDYFRRTRVNCALINRKQYRHGKKTKFLTIPDNKAVRKKHNHGFIVCDALPRNNIKLIVRKKGERPPRVRAMVAFMGGINFSEKQYSSPDKIFDFGRNAVHNIFVKVEDYAAADCLQIFTENWQCHCSGSQIKRLFYRLRGSIAESQIKKVMRTPSWTTLLYRKRFLVLNEEKIRDRERKAKTVNIEEDDSLLREDNIQPLDDNQPNMPTSIQIVRSSNSNSSKFTRELTFPSIAYQCGQKVDMSLEKSIIHLIRVAERFIYIETNMLVGFSQAWLSEEDKQANNIVVSELVAKLKQKMKTGTKFHLYLNISLLHGDSESITTEAKKTMHFLLSSIKMLTEKMDVLQDEYVTLLSLAALDSYSDVKKPVMVSANIVIIDDQTMLVSSGAFKEETLNGSYDTAIGVICSDFSKQRNNYIKSFRITLWADHLGAGSMVNDFDVNLVQYPEESNCIRYIQTMARENSKVLSGLLTIGDMQNYRKKGLIEFPLCYNSETQDLGSKYPPNENGIPLSNWLG